MNELKSTITNEQIKNAFDVVHSWMGHTEIHFNGLVPSEYITETKRRICEQMIDLDLNGKADFVCTEFTSGWMLSMLFYPNNEIGDDRPGIIINDEHGHEIINTKTN